MIVKIFYCKFEYFQTISIFQTGEQASSSGEAAEGSGTVTQSSMEEPGPRSQPPPNEGDWRQMKPDQSSVHSPGVAAGSSSLQPVSPQGK